MAELFREIGRSSGLNIIQWQDGREERVTDDELAALRGAPAVKKLEDGKRVKALEAEVDQLKLDKAELATQAEHAKGLQEKAEAVLAEALERAEKAEATVAELEAKVAQLEAAPATVTTGDQPKKGKKAKE